MKLARRVNPGGRRQMPNRESEIHLRFKPHAPADAFYAPSRYASSSKRAFVFEHSVGSTRPLGAASERAYLERMRDKLSPRSLARTLFLISALESGQVVFPGEWLKPSERAAFSALDSQRRQAFARAFLSRDVSAIRDFYGAQAQYERSRHELIRSTLQRLPTPLTAQFGTAHSLLTAELAREGVASSRDLKPVIFDLPTALVRKLARGGKPSDREYKLAFLHHHIGGFTPMKSASDANLQTHFLNMLLHQMTDAQVDHALHQTRLEFPLLPSWAPHNRVPTRAEMRAYLTEHSPDWRRYMAAIEQRRKTSNKRPGKRA
ncbi:Uncharacterised protein [uncultured archaeon]|nr:Uncharacterised protein [uncultured archaeon]